MASEPTYVDLVDKRLNEIVAAGAIWMALHTTAAVDISVETIYDEGGQATPAMHVRVPFLKSRYRITVEMDPEEGDPRDG